MRMHDLPDARGHFGPYGGVFVAETLSHALEQLLAAYGEARGDPAFGEEFHRELKHYVGRPSPVYHARRWSELLGGAQIYLKREDLNHTGAHKINNTIGQALLARRMGKPRVIAETGAGMHGVATATVAARYGMQCVVYMGSEDIRRQAQNVYRMKLLGASVVPVESGSKTLKDALNEAMRDWVANVDNTFYIIGTVAGPHPYPMMVRDFQAVIGEECKWQMPEIAGRQPDASTLIGNERARPSFDSKQRCPTPATAARSVSGTSSNLPFAPCAPITTGMLTAPIVATRRWPDGGAVLNAPFSAG
jgi:tryptophan synthase beta chain